MPFKGPVKSKEKSWNQTTHTHTNTHTHLHTCSHHTQENGARIMLDIIFYLLLILFTSRCQFEWQVAEHFRVCLLASTWGCQSLTGIHSVCRREAAPRWLAAVCLSWKCSASAGQERKRGRGRVGGGLWCWWGMGVLMDLSQPGVERILHHFISKMEMSRLGTSPQQLESGPVVYLFHFLPFLYKQHPPSYKLLLLWLCLCLVLFLYSSLHPSASRLPSLPSHINAAWSLPTGLDW